MAAWILAAFLVTSAADSVTTYQAVTYRGARESNPLMASVPLGVALTLKTGTAIAVSVAVAKAPHKTPLLWVLGALSVVQLSVAIRNHQVGR